MRKPEIGMTNLKLFIKYKSGFLVAGWTANKGDELHGDYEYVKDRVQGEKLLNDLKKIGMGKQRLAQCVRCGRHIREEANKLWCDKCIIRVNEELEGKADRDFRYYFRWNLRHKK